MVQCTCLTGSGTQCKRQASKGSKYCYQHKTCAKPAAKKTTSSSKPKKVKTPPKSTASSKSSPSTKSSPKSKCDTKVCPPEKICNPKSGLCVNSKGAIGRKIISGSKPKPKAKSSSKPKAKTSSGKEEKPPRVELIANRKPDEPIPLRGLHLDPARRQLTCEKILEIVQKMAIFKLNTLHLHLTDDQGIAIEIDTLSFYGTKRGEYHTLTIEEQERIGDLCEKLGIDIIPEIDIPGHTVALRSLLEDGEYKPEPIAGVKPTPGLLRTEDIPTVLKIFDELVKRFKVKKYIHMGGDETKGVKKPYFVDLVDKVCEWADKKKLQVVAWDDILGKVDDPPDNLIIQRWQRGPRNPAILRGVEKIGLGRVIWSSEYYLDTSPDPFTMFDKPLKAVEFGCIACSWGELIGMENIDAALYPSIAMLGARWSMTCDTAEEALKLYYDDIIWAGNRDTWKRKQWTGWKKPTGLPQPRATETEVSRPLTREDDQYPNCSKFLVDMELDLFDRMTGESDSISSSSVKKYKKAFSEAKADKKLVDALFEELKPKKPNLKSVMTAMRRVQKSQEAEEQLDYKNGLRMVLRQLGRYKP